jgi:hypothetical protein
MALLSISLYAQKTQVPQIDDNTVIVKTEVDSTTFNRLKVTLISNGYRIKEQDKSIGYIQTDYKSIEARNKACFLPHVSGMCLTSSASKLCNNLFKALPLTVAGLTSKGLK